MVNPKIQKVAIMTWYKYRNFGSVLQAYATQHVLRDLDFDPHLIDYKPKGRRRFRDGTMLSMVEKALLLLELKLQKKYVSKNRNALFDDFIAANIKQTPQCNSREELAGLNREFKIFICGSDQIWSPNRFDANFFLEFVEPSGCKISYAPSFGQARVKSKKISSRIASLLKRFDYLSVREAEGQKIVMELAQREAKRVLDPTLLVDQETWSKIANHEVAPDNGYILCYFLGNASYYWRQVRIIQAILKLPVLVIPTFNTDCQLGAYVHSEVGPNEFLGLVDGASHVCTDSFHGVAFSINFRKEFTVFQRFKEDDPDEQNSRINSVLEMFNLTERLCRFDSVNGAPEDSITWSAARETLGNHRENSLRFLSEALFPNSKGGVDSRG